MHFDIDREMKSFDMVCAESGRWIGPTPRCITDKGTENAIESILIFN